MVVDLSIAGMIAAFLAGAVSFLSPCVLPLVPAYVSYIAGHAHQNAPATAFSGAPAAVRSLLFVLGFSAVFITLGASASLFGQYLLAYRYELNIVGGLLIILFGIFLTGLVRIPWLEHELRFHPSGTGKGPASAFILGLAFGFGWTPCIGPILGAVLTMGAQTATVSQGVGLLSIYSLGLAVPFLAAALLTDRFVRRLRTLGRWGRRLNIVAGGIMILLGVAMITGYLSVFAFWLLETFPVFSSIG